MMMPIELKVDYLTVIVEGRCRQELIKKAHQAQQSSVVTLRPEGPIALKVDPGEFQEALEADIHAAVRALKDRAQSSGAEEFGPINVFAVGGDNLVVGCMVCDPEH